MKKWLFRVGAAAILLLAGFAGAVLWSEYDKTVASEYTSNAQLNTIKPGWPGTPVDEKGRFVNDEHPFLMKTASILKWTLSRNPQAVEKKSDAFRIEIRDPYEFLASEKDGILWLGHASVYIRLKGKGILIDPVFGDPSFLKRTVAVESPLDKLKTVDYVLVSHDHRDHADSETIRQIARKFPRAVFLSGLGMDDILADWTAGSGIQTAGWFQQFDLGAEDVKIYFLPVRHWCRRGLFDMNRRLWGGFIIQGGGTTVYFGGDSGYGRHYRETAGLFPEIDYFLIGIGAYKPRWFMEPNHNSPEDALKAFADSGAKTLVPIHYGTFDLSDEPPGEPLRLLNEAATAANLSDRIKPLAIGESIEIGN